MRLGLGMLIATLAIAAGPARAAAPVQAPELTHADRADWINSEPLTLAALRGKVVLIELWTFDCINCRRTLPWLAAMHQRYGDEGLTIVSVHAPELAHEREPANVRAAVEELGVKYAVMLDNDFSYWNALGNRYWPAFYLVGRTGRIEATAIGELHLSESSATGERRLREGSGARFEGEIRRLLAAR